jgi:hypothetical protein
MTHVATFCNCNFSPNATHQENLLCWMLLWKIFFEEESPSFEKIAENILRRRISVF